MGFVENLRMQSLFGRGIARPIKYGDREQLPIDNREADGLTTADKIKLQLAALARVLGPQNEARGPNQGMNVVYKEPITPFQRESLALRDRGLDINEMRTNANINLGQQRIGLQAERNRGFDERTDIQKQRADIYAFKAKNPNLRFDFSGPTVKVANPITGDIQDTGIATGNLSDEDRINLTQENALERLNVTNQARTALENVRQTNRLNAQTNQSGLRQNEIRLRDELGEDETSPNQVKIRNYNNAKELAARYPWLIQNKHLVFDDASGTFQVNQGALDETKYNDLLDKIYGTKTAPLPNKQTEIKTDNNPDTIKRNQAIEILKKNNKPITENNIKFVMGQIK